MSADSDSSDTVSEPTTAQTKMKTLCGAAVWSFAVIAAAVHQGGASGTPSDREVVIFATGYDGPIDNDDDWRFFDFKRATTIVSLGGRVPSKLVARAHEASVKVAWGTVLDVDISNKSAVAAWVSVTAKSSALVDGVHVVSMRNQRHTNAGSLLPQALAILRAAIGPEAQLSVTLPLSVSPGEHIDRPAVARQVDFIVLKALDQNVGSRLPEATIALNALRSALSETTIPLQKAVIALPWYGWDFRCSEFTAGECFTLPPPSSAATWQGWNVKRSVTFIQDVLATRNGSQASLNKTAMDMHLNYNDRRGVSHVVR